jgi:hypothetical protein|tara:strand:- start:615 stop:1061 length:447 start_codon:yes stop_codon:yes gene_type:complete
MNPQIDMNELDFEARKKNMKRLEIYNKILMECHNKIRFNSKLDRKYCFFLVPEFIFGTPLYDIEELRNHVMNSLQKNGFQLMYIHPNWLFISWTTEINSAKKQIKKVKEVSMDYRPIEEYRPTGTMNRLVYDDATLLSMHDKTRQLNI